MQVMEAILSRLDERRPVFDNNDDIYREWVRGGFHGHGFLARAEAELLDCTVMPRADGDLGAIELAFKTDIPEFLLQIPAKKDHYAVVQERRDEAATTASVEENEVAEGAMVSTYSLPVLPQPFPSSPEHRSESLESLGSLVSPSSFTSFISFSQEGPMSSQRPPPALPLSPLVVSPQAAEQSASPIAKSCAKRRRQAVPRAHTVLREIALSLQWLNDRGVAHTCLRPESLLR